MKKYKSNIIKSMIYVWGLLWINHSFAQNIEISLDEALELASKNNPQMKIADLKIESSTILKGTKYELPKSNFQYMGGQYNSVNWDNSFSITQSVNFPSYYAHLGDWLKENLELNSLYKELNAKEVRLLIEKNYYDLQYFQHRKKVLKSQDSIYQKFNEAVQVRFKIGALNLLEKTSSEMQLAEHQNIVSINENDLQASRQILKSLLVMEQLPICKSDLLPNPNSLLLNNEVKNPEHPLLKINAKHIQLNQLALKLEKSKLLPDINLGYFNQSLTGWQTSKSNENTYYSSSYRFQGFQFGLGIPLIHKANSSKIKWANLQIKVAESEFENQQIQFRNQLIVAQNEVHKWQNTLNYYQTVALKQANLISSQNNQLFIVGEITYTTYLQTLQKATSVQLAYIEALHQYHLALSKYNYLTQVN